MPTQLLGRGIYDLVEAARMLQRDPYTIARWTQGAESLHPVSQPSLCFLDVISLHVISRLRQENVPLKEIRRGGRYLANKLNTPYPFAHQQLATAGAAFFGTLPENDESGLENWYDLGKWGQGSFQETIQDVLQPIAFGSDQLARVWRPAEGVLVNPLVQAGAPCIEGTRVPTRLIADLISRGESATAIANDLDLEISQVKAAIAYEKAA